ncbi:uncharacterized protein K02A2.6-like [Ornithodoros turicata]|uniref:uncharacterized protein K02A2.6-like n=1 Tax=Ornithodoros turicata TaxID=34597 RepID=UPI003138BDD0
MITFLDDILGVELKPHGNRSLSAKSFALLGLLASYENETKEAKRLVYPTLPHTPSPQAAKPRVHATPKTSVCPYAGRLWSQHPKLQQSSTILRTWAHQQVPILGSLDVDVQFKNVKARQSILIALGGPCLLGRSWFTHLGIQVQVAHAVIDKRGEWLSNPVFRKGQGKLTGTPVSVDIEKEATIVFKKYRPIPFAMRDKVVTAIQKMVSEGVLEPIAFSRWTTRIFPVHKRGSTLRICVDCRCIVNTVSQPNKYTLRTATEMFAILANGPVFGKLDLPQVYLQMPVDEESSKLLTLNTASSMTHIPSMNWFNISAAGIRPCTDNVKAIHDAGEPRDKKELQAFLGLVNFYERLKANKATLPESLHQLLDKNAN